MGSTREGVHELSLMGDKDPNIPCMKHHGAAYRFYAEHCHDRVTHLHNPALRDPQSLLHNLVSEFESFISFLPFPPKSISCPLSKIHHNTPAQLSANLLSKPNKASSHLMPIPSPIPSSTFPLPQRRLPHRRLHSSFFLPLHQYSEG